MGLLSPLPESAAGWVAFLLELSVRSTLVLAVAAAACLALRRGPAALRHLIWVLAILCVLCLPLVSMLRLPWQVRGLPRVMKAAVDTRPPLPAPPPLDAAMAWAPRPAAVHGAPRSASAGLTRGATVSRTIARAPRTWSACSIALTVWAAGGIVAFLYALAGLLCVARLRRRSCPITDPSWCALLREAGAQLHLRRPVTLLRSPVESVPMMWGWRRPTLLLPAGANDWSPERRRLVLLHELAHARRAGWLTQMLGHIARAIHWFNPAIWVALRQLRREREQACDDLVLRSGFRASDYAEHLLSIVRALPRPTFAEAVAVAMSRPAGVESRIRAILDPLRSHRGVTRRTAVIVALFAAGLLVALASMQAAGANAAPGLHDQWQPQTEHDARLAQPVHIEILGRGAVPALALLSEKTGVSLRVAPQDLETVGDRKLTVIAQGCSLKTLMVQIPSALQECHWDVDVTGPQPAYLLHRNAGVESTMAELAQEVNIRAREERRPEREARMAEARAALAMSPEELDGLMKTDPLLAATVKDPEARHRLELLLNLPAKDMREFIETGRAYLPYSSAPAAYQEAARRTAESFVKENATSDEGGLRGWAEILPDLLPTAAVYYEDYDDMGVGPGIQCFDTTGKGGRKGDFLRLGMGGGIALPPRLLTDDFEVKRYQKLLISTGMDEKAADMVLTGLVAQSRDEHRQARDQTRAREWREPRSPALHKTVTLPFKDEVDKLEMQRFIAKQTGLSLVSDYFTTWGSGEIPEEAKAAAPVWRLLYLLGEGWFWRYDWNEAGDCLVFHDRMWYILAPQEFPEAMVLAYREKLKQQGRFTLDDVAAAAVELARRRPVPPRQRGEWPWAWVNVPEDLIEAGLTPQLRSEALLLYVSLTPAQRERAGSADGLPFAEMTAAQQDLIRPLAFFEGGWNHDKHPLPDEEISQAVFRVKAHTETRQVRRHHTDPVTTETADQLDLRVEFPSLDAGTGLWLRTPKQP